MVPSSGSATTVTENFAAAAGAADAAASAAVVADGVGSVAAVIGAGFALARIAYAIIPPMARKAMPLPISTPRSSDRFFVGTAGVPGIIAGPPGMRCGLRK